MSSPSDTLSNESPNTPPFILTPISTVSKTVLGYFVSSTASTNVEDPSAPSSTAEMDKALQDIAAYLVQSTSPELSISIHGYSTLASGAQKRFQAIHDYAITVCQPDKHVFLGYIWPSEPPLQGDSVQSGWWRSIQTALQALPTLLIGNFIGAFILGVVAFLLTLGVLPSSLGWLLGTFLVSGLLALGILAMGEAVWLLYLVPVIIGGLAIALVLLAQQPWGRSLLPLFLVLFVFSFTIIFALVAMRLVTYFRDQSRASNYAVLDLVELIRKLEQKVLEARHQNQDPTLTDSQPRIKLNFLAHSMGCFVATNAIRILSDVFDPTATIQQSSSKLGKTLSLGRLILVAPDISVEATMPGRNNVLQASLRRCQEAYIFSSEGDLALRLASTAANYINFPARTRFRGYRLGNLNAQHFQNEKDQRWFKLNTDQYGIVNLNLKNHVLSSPHKYLELRASAGEHQNLVELNQTVLENLKSRYENSPLLPDTVKELTLKSDSIVNRFTLFDCTDYTDIKHSPDPTKPDSSAPIPILSHALKKSALHWIDYVWLSVDYFFKSKIDTHGGYFEGKFCQSLMYELLFLGFDRFLLTYDPHPATTARSVRLLSSTSTTDQQRMLLDFHKDCQAKQLQVVLSPQRIA